MSDHEAASSSYIPLSTPSEIPNAIPEQQTEMSFKIYKPFDSTPGSRPPLPDDYFTPTAHDLKAAQTQLAARTQSLTNAPLQLKAKREAEEKAKSDRWPTTTIRVRFPDRTQLEKVFPSTNKIRTVYAFVRELLREDVKATKFVLYQPPKRDLKVSDPKVRDLTLSQLQLAPSSILQLRFEDEALNHTTIPAPLIGTVLSQAVEMPKPPDIPDSVPTSQTQRIPKSSSASSSGEKKKPKWMKMGKK